MMNINEYFIRADGFPIRVLIIDDEYELHARLRTDLNTILQHMEIELELTVATSITEAFRSFSKNKTHLIVLDPILSAYSDDLISDLRNARGMPILVFSPEFSPEKRIHYLKMGADMVLPKPAEYEEYLLSARALLKRYYTVINQLDEADIITRYKKLELDPLRRIVVFDNVVQSLTRKEFDVLKLLSDHPGKVLTKDYIFINVWDADFGDGDKSVTDIIHRLRKKLGKEFNEEYIENIYSTGYRFGSVFIRS